MFFTALVSPESNNMHRSLFFVHHLYDFREFNFLYMALAAFGTPEIIFSYQHIHSPNYMF
jgi:hypothetical protein